jgi:hypothetical protein
MVKNETKDQIPLFELRQPEILEKATPENETGSSPNVMNQELARDKKSKSTKKADKKTIIMSPVKKAGRVKSGNSKTTPGPVPDGDVRLTANIREDLHLKLKIIAATRRTTIGELLEDLVINHL